MINQKKRNQKINVSVGDVFAAPLPIGLETFGYIRAYQDPDIAILPTISEGKIISAEELPSLASALYVASLRNAMENGQWKKIANIPFPDEESTWAPPRRQLPLFKSDTRKIVISRGQLVPATAFENYDSLPVMIRLDDEGLIKKICELAPNFQIAK